MVRQHALGRAVIFTRRLVKTGPGKLLRRWAKRKARKLSGRKTTSVIRGGQLTKKAAKAYGTTAPVRAGGRHDIVPGRTLIVWRPYPEYGRGRVLAILPNNYLDVEFEYHRLRPPNGCAMHEIVVVAS